MPRILISDEQGVYSTGLCILITKRIPGSKVAEASSHADSFSRIRYDGVFDLVLLGLNLRGISSFNALKAARELFPATRCAVTSVSDSHEEILASLTAGFHGFISKHQSDDEVIAAIKDLLSGRIYIPWPLAEANDPAPLSRERGGALPMIFPEDNVPNLTRRQRDVLSFLAHGASNKEIARELRIAEATTKIHMAALLRALGVRNRTEAASRAAKLIGSAPSLGSNALAPMTHPDDACILKMSAVS
ncbi:MAG: response regulator transcription factor [Rhodoplanes sp.]